MQNLARINQHNPLREFAATLFFLHRGEARQFPKLGMMNGIVMVLGGYASSDPHGRITADRWQELTGLTSRCFHLYVKALCESGLVVDLGDDAGFQFTEQADRKLQALMLEFRSL